MPGILMHFLYMKKHVNINGINDKVIARLSVVLNERSAMDDGFNRKEFG